MGTDRFGMRKLALTAIITGVVVVWAGCEQTGRRDEFEDISRKMEELKRRAAESGGGLGNIKVMVNMLSTGEHEYSAVNALWRYADENVALVGRGDVYSGSGLRIGIGHEDFMARLDLVKRSLRSAESSEVFVVLADGATGYINVGREIAVPVFIYRGRRYSAVEYEFRRAGRSLEVVARKLPNGMIEMQLTPVFSQFLTTGGDMRLTELSTTVLARPGQTVIIGGSDWAANNVASALFSTSRRGERGRTLVTVTPYLQ